METSAEKEIYSRRCKIVENKLTSLNENDFRKDILIPLFKAMGYKNVIDYHGGSKEQGKDIVMWKDEELSGRQNYAVVVKVGQITGKVGGKGTFQSVATQAIQALNSTFHDESTLEEQQIHKCFIVTNETIKKEATDALFSVLKNHVDSHRVNIFNLNNLVEKIIEYNILPENTNDLFSMLDKINSEKIFKIKGIRYCDGKKIIDYGTDKISQSEKTKIKMTLTFPNDEDGHHMKKKVRDFLDHGGPIDIPGKYIKIDSPEFNNEISDKGIAHISIGNITNPKIFHFGVEIIDDDNNSFHIPYLELKKTRAGRKSFTLVCDSELLAFTMSIRIESDNTTQFNYSLKKNLSNYTMYELLLFEEFKSAISKGGSMNFYDAKTNIRILPFRIEQDLNCNSDKFFYELIKKGAIIQQKTNTRLYYPNKGFSENDIHDIDELYSIITTGYKRNIYTTITFHLKDMQYLQNHSNSNEIQKLDLMMQVSEEYIILNKKINLGTAMYYINTGILNYQIISDEDIEVKVTTNKDCPACICYEKYSCNNTKGNKGKKEATL